MIKHILSDGRVLDSIEGFCLPYTSATATVYRLLAEILEGGGGVDAGSEKTRPTAAQKAAAAN